MGKNLIQFQEGMSLYEFQEEYGTEELCREALLKHRWPHGFVCPKCSYDNGGFIKTRSVYQCYRCDHQVSVTAGTIFHSTKLALTKWFMGIYLITQSKNGISSLELRRLLGVNHKTAYRMKQKIMHVMLQRNNARRIGGNIIIDDSYLGGERTGGKRGRGTRGKTPFVAAVEVNEKGHPIRIKLNWVPGFGRAALEEWGRRHLFPGSTVVSDGLDCFTAIGNSGHKHTPIITGSGKKAVKNPVFTWINTVLGNLKNALSGTYHSFDPKHAARYLAEFQYRFNRRFNLKEMIPRFVYVAARTSPCPDHLLVLSENEG